MAVFQQCPICRAKQKTSLKKCRACGEDLIIAKRSNRVKYWICNQINKKKVWKSIGFSIQEAQDADGKVRAQKRENPFFDTKDQTITFNDLISWYTGLVSVRKKKYFPTLEDKINKFNAVFGEMKILRLRKSDLENYQATMLEKSFARGTIDLEISCARIMVQAAVDDDRLSGDCLKPFRRVKKLLKPRSNARDKILTFDELLRIFGELPKEIHGIVALGFFGGMRLNEILDLTWDKVNLQCEYPHIKLEAKDTKEGREKTIPLARKVSHNPFEIIKTTPRALHDNHVFLRKNGKKFIDKEFRLRLKRACKRAGVAYGRFSDGGFIFHDLRHCFNTYMRRAGVDQLTIMAIMGHSPGRGLEMTYRYSTFDLADLGRAAERLEDYLTDQGRKVKEDGR